MGRLLLARDRLESSPLFFRGRKGYAAGPPPADAFFLRTAWCGEEEGGEEQCCVETRNTHGG
jgi:hypothetical protein